MSGAKTEPQRPKSTKNNFRRAKSIVAISSNSPKSVRKIYQGVGKRSLSPNKSPQETRKIPAISCLTLAAESSHNLGNCPSPATKLLRKKAVQESPSYNPRGNRK
ncbi:hypothetical protein RRG08_007047 [Elysia crispata]|uniref:Uncharacterized protein n=1 Tax=Elysia crispata TaxID=231223 RepID=A0AAE0ZJL3_9GAST|nr:hypothetical protein RRG08_007047 [Elysia crispata]